MGAVLRGKNLEDYWHRSVGRFYFVRGTSEFTVARKQMKVQGLGHLGKEKWNLPDKWEVKWLVIHVAFEQWGEAWEGGSQAHEDVPKQPGREAQYRDHPSGKKSFAWTETPWVFLENIWTSISFPARVLRCFWKERRNLLKYALFFPVYYAFLKTKASWLCLYFPRGSPSPSFPTFSPSLQKGHRGWGPGGGGLLQSRCFMKIRKMNNFLYKKWF